jgi:copper chaperone
VSTFSGIGLAVKNKNRTMSTYHFKTNINCLGCVTQIKPHLDKLEQEHTIEHWHVNMNDPEYLLEIETNKLSPDEVKHLVREAGFEAEFTRAPR